MTWHKQPGAGKASVKMPHVAVPKPHMAKAPKPIKASKTHGPSKNQRTAPKSMPHAGGKK
jgi:hypothetical protein